MPTSLLILDYVRAIVWPLAVVIVALLVLRD